MLSRITAICIAIISLALLAPLPSAQAASPSHQYRVLLPLVLSAQPATPDVTHPTPSVTEQTPEAQTLVQINQQRIANGCPPVQMNTELSLAAARHSRDMAVQNYVSHRGKDGSTFSQRARAAQYPFQPSGEIIAAGRSTTTATLTDWMNSPGHRAIILNCTNDDIGIGMYADPTSEWRYYWTAVFGQR